MRCRHCGSLIAEDEHRCHRCGRRLQEGPVYVDKSAAAPVLETVEVAEPARSSSSSAPARQVSLFDDRPKIIPFESIGRRKISARKQRAAVRETRSTPAPQISQQPLDLRAPAPREKKAVSDDVPVASPLRRMHAAVIDTAFLAAGIGVGGVAFALMGGQVAMTPKGLLPAGVTLTAVVMFYHLFWSILGRETAGMRSAGLRVLTFDGHAPTWKQRVARLLLACLGVVAVGIGLLWALIDDEGLTWHDHISKTFPTEYDPDPSTVRRR